ncbi:MAG: 3-isopropylmalate dehydratase [Phycisphaerae bacterium]|nr:3-isopropylmalate dehydratase [Phycisphaerae bacterium]
MEDTIRGLAYVLGDDVDTDQIIPAKHLVYSTSDPKERCQYGRLALTGVPEGRRGLPKGDVPFVDPSDPANTRSDFTIIVAGANFGCGSSREHAPLALAEAGVRAVIAESYARIFFRNSVNGGYVIPYETPNRLIEAVATGDELELNAAGDTLVNLTRGAEHKLRPLGDVAPIVEAGGIFEYARRAGML